MRGLAAFPLTRKMALWVSAVAVGAAFYFRISTRTQDGGQNWNRLDRNSSMPDASDGSFPASDPPSTVPAGWCSVQEIAGQIEYCGFAQNLR